MNTHTHNILIAALGGEGGGVLADWIISAATIAGYPIQSTSIPGVAQRTGATTYYLEMFPQKLAELRGAQPVLALTPTPGDIDVVISSELVEAGRALQNGFATPERTTLIASTSRVYAIAERSAMADGRFDSERIMQAALELSRRAILFDMNEMARTSGTPVNAIMFGALIASQTLPINRSIAEAAIRQTGKAADRNLAGFAVGFETASRSPNPEDAAVAKIQEQTHPNPMLADIPLAARDVIGHGVVRLIDYQSQSYADRFLDRLYPIIKIEHDAGRTDFVLTQETARYLALWMSYEDVIRVADLKTRADRRARIRSEVRAKGSDIVCVVDFLKPGLEELCSVMPPALGRALFQFAVKRGFQHRLNVGLHVRSTSVTGFILLRALAALRWWRPYSWRFQEEHARMQRWLAAITRAAARDLALAVEIAACGQIMKGYGDTHARAVRNFDLIANNYFGSNFAESAQLAMVIHAARKAALADPEGESLAVEITKSPAALARTSRQLATAE
jgi:indolepyruvate ferredoxin oxidoreductase beta subunit